MEGRVMTVAELIAQLQAFPGEYAVRVGVDFIFLETVHVRLDDDYDGDGNDIPVAVIELV
jgi:hypothetical protein